MQSNHASALRGLSIAVVIIAGLSILACVIGFVFLGVGGNYLANTSPDVWEYYLYDGDYYGYDYGYDHYGFDGSDMAALMAVLVGLGGILLFWELALSAVALIAGILGLRNYNDPTKLSLVFGWSLAGAIASFLCGSIVVMTLLIIMCVFAYKDKQLAAAQPIVVTQPVTVAPAQPVQTAQPVVPVQPVATPVATVQPATPAAPEVAQPAATAEAVAAEIDTPITESVEPAAEPSALTQEETPEAAEEAKAE